jgi:hypothetical protein
MNLYDDCMFYFVHSLVINYFFQFYIISPGNNSKTLKFNFTSSFIASKWRFKTVEDISAFRDAERFLDGIAAASIAATRFDIHYA